MGRWYLDKGPQRDAILSTVCLAGPKLLWTLIAAVVGLCVFLAGRVVARAAVGGLNGRAPGMPTVISI